MNDRVNLGGIPVDSGVDIGEIFGWLTNPIGSRQIITLNANIFWYALQQPRLSAIIKGADRVICDGSGILLALERQGYTEVTKLPGVTLARILLDFCAQYHYPVYFYGGRDKTVLRLVKVIPQYWPGLPLSGFSDGYGILKKKSQVTAEILASPPRLLLVGLGSPAQEYYLAEVLPRLNGTVGIGVGGTLEILAGIRREPPQWIRDGGWEWLYRMIEDPRRLNRFPSLVRFWYQFLRR